METDFGLRVFWDNNWCVRIQVPDTFSNKVKGLCGTLSNNKDDDFTNPLGGLVSEKKNKPILINNRGKFLHECPVSVLIPTISKITLRHCFPVNISFCDV